MCKARRPGLAPLTNRKRPVRSEHGFAKAIDPRKVPTSESAMSFEPGAFQQQVAPLLAEMEASANAHDTDRHLAAYARDPALTFIINGEIIRGWDSLRERQRQWWNERTATGIYEYLGEPTYEAFGKDLGLTTLLIAARMGLPDGQVRERQLAFTALWRRREEGWRIIYAHESSSK